jgi:hypothetical protein
MVIIKTVIVELIVGTISEFLKEADMLEGRSMYVWQLDNTIFKTNVAAGIAKAQAAKLSHLIVKIADGTKAFKNTAGDLGGQLKQLVTQAHAAGISAFGYHVPHCETNELAVEEADFVAGLLDKFKLDGVFVDNEDGGSYFKGGAAEAEAYATELKAKLAPVGRKIVMSSNDILSAHPKAYGKVIGHAMDANAPQVYYGQSATVQKRLQWAVKENSVFAAPFAPIGAGWVRKPGDKTDAGCASAADCAQRARDFIGLVSLMHHSNPTKFPGYGFWDWDEVPDELWAVLNELPVFDQPGDA